MFWKTMRRWSRPIRHRLGALVLQLITLIIRALPLTWVQRLGRLTGRIVSLGVWVGAPSLRRLIHSQLSALSHRLPPPTEGQVSSPPLELSPPPSSGACWADLGQRLFEWLKGAEATRTLMWAPAETRELLEEVSERAKAGEPWICLSAHYGHWELMAACLSAWGLPFTAVASTPQRGPLGRWLSQQRRALNVSVVHPQGGARLLSKSLRRGAVVALLIDQATGERYQTRTLLGREAPISLTAARLINAHHARVIWVCSQRESEGKYKICAQRLQSADPTQEALQLLERLIYNDPEQWVWIHDRWTPHPRGRPIQKRDSRGD
jgi:lauroyl/myristoyl acyltransferase